MHFFLHIYTKFVRNALNSKQYWLLNWDRQKVCSPSVLPAAVDHFLLLDGLHAGHLLAAKVLRIFTFRFRFCGFNTEGRSSKDF